MSQDAASVGVKRMVLLHTDGGSDLRRDISKCFQIALSTPEYINFKSVGFYVTVSMHTPFKLLLYAKL